MCGEGGGVLPQKFICLNGVILDEKNMKIPFHKSQGWEIRKLDTFHNLDKGTTKIYRERMTVSYWTLNFEVCKHVIYVCIILASEASQKKNW